MTSGLHHTSSLTLLPHPDVLTSAFWLHGPLTSHVCLLTLVTAQDAVQIAHPLVLRPVRLSVIEHPFPVDTPSGLCIFLMSQVLTLSKRLYVFLTVSVIKYYYSIISTFDLLSNNIVRSQRFMSAFCHTVKFQGPDEQFDDSHTAAGIPTFCDPMITQ